MATSTIFNGTGKVGTAGIPFSELLPHYTTGPHSLNRNAASALFGLGLFLALFYDF
jgi:hypothetical protein